MKLLIFSAVLTLASASPLFLGTPPLGCYETWSNDINFVPNDPNQAQNCSNAPMCFKAISVDHKAIVFGCDEFQLCKGVEDGTCKENETGTTCCCRGRLCNGNAGEWTPTSGSSSSKAPSTSTGPYVPPETGFQCYYTASADPTYEPKDPKLLVKCNATVNTCFKLTALDNSTLFDCDNNNRCAGIQNDYCHHDPTYGTLCCCNEYWCNGMNGGRVDWYTESTKVAPTTHTTQPTPSTTTTSKNKGVASVTIVSAFLSVLVHNLM